MEDKNYGWILEGCSLFIFPATLIITESAYEAFSVNYLPDVIQVLLGLFISVINQLDAQNFCFTMSLFHASTCFEHMCSSSGGQNCITQPLVSSHL